MECESFSIDAGLPFSILARHNGHVIDLTGTEGAQFRNVCITNAGGSTPLTGFYQSRNSSVGPSGPSVGQTRFENCNVIGAFSIACYYNYGAEGDEIVGGFWMNTYTTTGAAVMVWTANNRFQGVQPATSSTFQPIPNTSQSCIDHKIIGGDFNNLSGNAAADVIYIESIVDLKVFGPWLSCSNGSAGGRSLIYCDMVNGPSNLIQLYAIQGENLGGAANPTYGIALSNNAQTPTGWTVDGVYWNVQSAAINGNTFDNLYFYNVQGTDNATNSSKINLTTLQNSIAIGPGMTITVVNSTGNCLIGDSSRWTIVTRQHDQWIDTGSANQQTGWGTPIGAAVINNYNITDAGGANSNTNKALAALIVQLKLRGIIQA
jgi:hypothetical protein